ncbi:MAG: diguanylate cyclase [Spongiibacter sp.]|nr:diguanylate cyclase [Spongiibacter sp.]
MVEPDPFGSMDWAESLVPKRPKLLVVDDQTVNIQALYQIFGADHEVFMATSGSQAIKVCLDKKPDLILLDVIMPEMDGIAVCEELQKNSDTRSIPVIFVTSQESPEEESRGLEVGAVDFISKPVNPAVVRARVRTHLTLKAQADALRVMASRDGLTGIPNRRYFDERLAAEWRSAKRGSQPLSLILIDVDHFKAYNDHYGHVEGDTCLRRVAKALKLSVGRGRDIVARYGGEEFVCLLPETDLAGAEEMAEKLRSAVADLEISHKSSPVGNTVTISLGAATIVPTSLTGPETLLVRTDELLYKAKESGRNRVVAQAI